MGRRERCPRGGWRQRRTEGLRRKTETPAVSCEPTGCLRVSVACAELALSRTPHCPQSPDLCHFIFLGFQSSFPPWKASLGLCKTSSLLCHVQSWVLLPRPLAPLHPGWDGRRCSAEPLRSFWNLGVHRHELQVPACARQGHPNKLRLTCKAAHCQAPSLIRRAWERRSVTANKLYGHKPSLRRRRASSSCPPPTSTRLPLRRCCLSLHPPDSSSQIRLRGLN